MLENAVKVGISRRKGRTEVLQGGGVPSEGLMLDESAGWPSSLDRSDGPASRSPRSTARIDYQQAPQNPAGQRHQGAIRVCYRSPARIGISWRLDGSVNRNHEGRFGQPRQRPAFMVGANRTKNADGPGPMNFVRRRHLKRRRIGRPLPKALRAAVSLRGRRRWHAG